MKPSKSVIFAHVFVTVYDWQQLQCKLIDYGEVGMTSGGEIERQRLRKERARLNGQIARLAADSGRIKDSASAGLTAISELVKTRRVPHSTTA